MARLRFDQLQRLRALAGQDNNYDQLVTFIHDLIDQVTRDANREQARLRDALQASDELLAVTARTGKVGGWEARLEPPYPVVWTEETYRIHEVEPGTPLTIDDMQRFYPPEVRPTLEAAWNNTVGQGVPYDIEAPLITRQGQRRWVRVIAHIERHPGKPDRVFGIIQDLTEQRAIEDASQEIDRRLRVISEVLSDFVYSVRLDANGEPQREWMAGNIEDVTGYSETELQLNPQIWIEMIYPEDRALIPERLARLKRGQVTITEYRIITKEGDIRWVRDYGRPEYDRSGRFVERVLGAVQNITQHKQVEDALKIALINERELSDFRSRFISMSTHELKNPIGQIQISANLLEQYWQRMPEAERTAKFRQIDDAITQMRVLIDDVLFVGRTDVGALPFEPTWLPLDRLCREVIDSFHAVTTMGYQLDYTGDHTHNYLFADVKLMRQALSNLLSNAIKYTPDGGAIRLHTSQTPTDLVIAISDTGIGIPPENYEKVFAPFERADNVGEIHGTGLGLFIVQRAIEMHGGDITFESVVGQGTTFRITLPIVHPEEVSV